MKKLLVFFLTLFLFSSVYAETLTSSNDIHEVPFEQITFKNTIAYANGKPYTGRVVEYKDDKRFLEYGYKNGIQEGLEIGWHTGTGKKSSEKNWKEGEQEGLYINYWPNGKKRRSVNYINGRVEGKATNWHKDGQIKKPKAKTIKVKPTVKTWQENGKRYRLETNWQKSGKKSSEKSSEVIYENGKKIRRYGYGPTVEKDGWWGITNVREYGNEKQEKRIKYRNYEKDKVQEVWEVDTNGRLLSHSEKSYYQLTGELKSIKEYYVKDGFRRGGKTTFYYRNGSIKEVYLNNYARTTKRTLYYKSGTIKQNVEFVNGKRSVSTSYHPTGELDGAYKHTYPNPSNWIALFIIIFIIYLGIVAKLHNNQKAKGNQDKAGYNWNIFVVTFLFTVAELLFLFISPQSNFSLQLMLMTYGVFAIFVVFSLWAYIIKKTHN